MANATVAQSGAIGVLVQNCPKAAKDINRKGANPAKKSHGRVRVIRPNKNNEWKLGAATYCVRDVKAYI
jgi:hypothetical protein